MNVAFEAARFDEAANVYDEAINSGSLASPEARILRARVELKRDQDKAFSLVVRTELAGASRGEQGVWSMLRGVAYARMRDYANADKHFAKARTLLTGAQARAELEYHLSRRFLLEGKVEQAAVHAEASAIDTSSGARIRTMLLQSFVLSHQERYEGEAALLLEVLEIIGNRRMAYVESWVVAVTNIAVLARELTSPKLAAAARRELEISDVSWPAGFADARWMALKAVGWTCALQGDMLGAFRYLRSAEKVASSPAYRAILALDRSFFAQIMQQKLWASDELSTAEGLAEDVDWNATGGDERIGLLLLAEAFVDTNLEKSNYYLTRYRHLDKMRSPLHLFAFDKRPEALEAFVGGLVLARSGDGDAAVESLRKAWTTFDRIRYDWRAGRVAILLYELTAKKRWLHLAEDKLEPYMNSWLATELSGGITGTGKAVSLSPMQRKVFEMLCNKQSPIEIAHQLGLSPSTVRNHLKGVFKAYGVNTQAALVAEAARRGDLPAAELYR